MENHHLTTDHQGARGLVHGTSGSRRRGAAGPVAASGHLRFAPAPARPGTRTPSVSRCGSPRVSRGWHPGRRRVEVRPGQTLWCPPGEEHWHGAGPDGFVEHLAMWGRPTPATGRRRPGARRSRTRRPTDGAWTSDALSRIGSADELRVSSYRPTAPCVRPSSSRVVRVGDDVTSAPVRPGQRLLRRAGPGHRPDPGPRRGAGRHLRRPGRRTRAIDAATTPSTTGTGGDREHRRRGRRRRCDSRAGSPGPKESVLRCTVMGGLQLVTFRTTELSGHSVGWECRP